MGKEIRKIGALDTIEESIQILRFSGMHLLTYYFAGTLPFVLGFLYFFADMSRSGLAHQNLAPASLGLACLFIWMKFWQAFFSGLILQGLTGAEPKKMTFKKLITMVSSQTFVHGLGLVIIPFATIFIFPFAVFYAFFQNFTILSCESTETGLRTNMKEAWRLGIMDMGQNIKIIITVAIFGLVVFINLRAAIFMLPNLLKTLFDIDTVFSLSGGYVFNSTLVAVSAGLIYLCVDPILKVAYALRCFHGKSRKSGHDLLAGLNKFAMVAVITAAVLTCSFTSISNAEEIDTNQIRKTSIQDTSPGISSEELDFEIENVLKQREFQWRLPRSEDTYDFELPGPMKSLNDWIVNAFEPVTTKLGEWYKKFKKWKDGLFKKGSSIDSDGTSRGSGFFGLELITYFYYILIFIAIVGAAIIAFKAYRTKKNRASDIEAAPAVSAVDINDENLNADDLPIDGWLSMAADFLKAGDLRSALRAFYLSILAGLSEKHIITIARFKSNLDYQNELKRRAHSLAELPELFAETVKVFERVWYGMHSIEEEEIKNFENTMKRIKAVAANL